MLFNMTVVGHKINQSSCCVIANSDINKLVTNQTKHLKVTAAAVVVLLIVSQDNMTMHQEHDNKII
jgi:hypothetical protein